MNEMEKKELRHSTIEYEPQPDLEDQLETEEREEEEKEEKEEQVEQEEQEEQEQEEQKEDELEEDKGREEEDADKKIEEEKIEEEKEKVREDCRAWPSNCLQIALLPNKQRGQRNCVGNARWRL